MAEYTPSEAEFRTALHDMIANGSDPALEDWTAERTAEFDRLLARVRGDAARKAVTEAMGALLYSEGASPRQIHVLTEWRNTHYPEETP